MFTRIVECRVKPDKRDEFNNKLRNDVLPILQKQPGFVDLIGLTSESDAERVISVSFWKSKEDAERYHREQYNRIVDTLKPTLERIPRLKLSTLTLPPRIASEPARRPDPRAPARRIGRAGVHLPLGNYLPL